jgi:hypothetical protein
MNMHSDGGRLDLADVERLAASDEEMAALWTEYQQAVDTLQHLESTSQARAGQWQASSHAENFFTEQSLVDFATPNPFFRPHPRDLDWRRHHRHVHRPDRRLDWL